MTKIVSLQSEVVRVNRFNDHLMSENKRLTELAQVNKSTLDVRQ